MDLYQDFVLQLKREKIWNPEEKVIIAVSGGVDSVVLLDLLTRLPHSLKPIITVAHVDHQLREASAKEIMLVKHLGTLYDVPVEIYKWPKEDHPQSGLELAARNVRYSFFKQLADELLCSTVLTAHHKNDQVETVLMRLVRGNSLDELKGIEPVRHDRDLNIARPLLNYFKSDLIAYAEERHLSWCEDETNETSEFTRNRYRNTIIPLLKEENPAVEDHIIRFSNEIKSVLALINPMIEEKSQKIIKTTDSKLIIDRESFINLDPFVQEKVLAHAIKKWRINSGFLLTHKHLSLFRKWLESSGPNTTLDLPHQLIARRVYDSCIIEPCSDQLNNEAATDIDKLLAIGEWIQLSTDEAIGLLPYSAYKKRQAHAGELCVYFNRDSSKTPLIVRHRKAGDRIVPKGMNGSKKLKDIFIDQKVPIQERDQAWVVTDNMGELLWVIDYKESTLSLDPITDTISYVLVYKNTKSN